MYQWCICGHGRDVHEYAMKPMCAVLIHKRNKLTGDRCPCDRFVRDNLRYLEELANGTN